MLVHVGKYAQDSPPYHATTRADLLYARESQGGGWGWWMGSTEASVQISAGGSTPIQCIVAGERVGSDEGAFSAGARRCPAVPRADVAYYNWFNSFAPHSVAPAILTHPTLRVFGCAEIGQLYTCQLLSRQAKRRGGRKTKRSPSHFLYRYQVRTMLSLKVMNKHRRRCK